MPTNVTTEYLVAHADALPRLTRWFEAEWPEWYGSGGSGDAAQDLLAYANRGSLPVGIVALFDGEPCGVMALKPSSIPSHSHLSPWAAAGYVTPSLRGRGIGSVLLAAIEREAEALGFPHIYCGTSTSASLLERRQWCFMEAVTLEGKRVGVYEKALQEAANRNDRSTP